MTQTKDVITFSKRTSSMPMPHLLDIQTVAFDSLLKDEDAAGHRQDVSLERVFKDLFPISDVNGKYSLDFLRYNIGEPKYSVEECIERDMTYAAPLKATLQLIVFEEVEGERRPKNIIEKEVYLGELPIMTPLGTFVINGAERVVVSQLHRSPGVVFEEDTHPNGQRLFSARIIPFRGSWVEFTIDIHDVIYVHIDKKKKFPATALLRAFGYGNNADILKLFFATKTLSLAGKGESRQEKREMFGSLLAEAVPNPEEPKGDPLGNVGDELTPERVNAMRHVGVKEVTVFAGYSSVDLREDETLVRARLAVRRDPTVLGDPPPLVLAGQELETLELAIDGRKLAAHEYAIDDESLEIATPPERFTLETLVRKFAYMRFEPEGITTNPEIPFAKSMPDYIMRWLASRFLDADTQEELGILTQQVRAKKTAEDTATGASGGSARPTNGGNGAPKAVAAKPPTAALTDTPPVVPARMIGLDLGPACNNCGGMMQRTGSCYTCSSCGNNTGCG